MADFFEFDESEVVFSDHISSSSYQNNCHDFPSASRLSCSRSTISRRSCKEEHLSVPVNIPSGSNSSSPCTSPRYVGLEFDGYLLEDDHNEIVPPHVIVERRSSSFDSYGKNAKGKNLIHVRNSILKLTGFLES